MNTTSAVPHLTTALVGPLQHIESLFLSKQTEIEAWFRAQWLESPAPIYCSVDLRNAGYKVAPVDTNLFPAGFNNLNPAFLPLCIQAVQSAFERICPKANRILIVPENHTRNLFYFESLATLQEIITKAGFETRIGSLREDVLEPETTHLPSGRELTLHPITRVGNKVSAGDFVPCMVILNNDLTAGRPSLLEGLEQPVHPPPSLGWSNRLKSHHFTKYQEVAREFSRFVDLDSWLIDPLFRNCGEINFMTREGEDCLTRHANTLFEALRLKYAEYGISRDPFIVVKADSGTYGMGVMTVSSTEELLQLNRKQRTRMAKTKEGQNVSRVILQEGVYTEEKWGEAGAVSEPVVYMIDHFVVGGFYRVHAGRGINENLNAPGMHFQPLMFAESCNVPDSDQSPDAEPNRFYTYGVIARLALLAAARELIEHPQITCSEEQT